MTYWAFDPRFNSSLAQLDFKKEFQETRDIKKTLRTIKESHPFISKAELYLDLDVPILLGSNYEEVKDENLNQYYRSVVGQAKSISWNYSGSRSVEYESESPDKLAITQRIPGVGEAFGAIIVTIDESKLIKLLDAMAGFDGGGAILVRDNDEILLSSNSLASEAFITYVKQYVAQTGKSEGSFLLDWEKEKYSISFGVMDRIGDEWKFISIAPITAITAPIIFISKMILVISITILLVGILISWFVSSNIYSPVKKLLHTIPDNGAERGKDQDEFEFIKDNLSTLSRKSETLQKQLFIHQPELRRSFLSQLGKGFVDNYTEQELRNRMESYGWQLTDKQFQLVDLQITGVYESDKMNGNDESLITFSVFNIVEEYISDFFEQFTVINYHDMSVGIFIITPEEAHTRRSLHYFFDGVAAIINRILDLKVTLTISESVRQAKQIPQLFEEVNRGKRLRIFENRNQVIDLSDWLYKERDVNVFYPFETEKAVVQAVRRGQIEEAEQGIRHFIDELKEKDVQEIHIQTGVVQLFSMIQHEIFQSGIHPSELFKSRNMVEELSEIREVEWIVTWIRDEVVTPYVRILESRMDIESKQLVEKVMDYIDLHYMKDTSLEQCAELVNANPYMLSKAFKKVLNINYIEYLTNVRITKAKELLWNTDMKISEISEKVGYRESYFNRIFKKQVGVTASHYRKMKSSDE
ncbi:AraC family transcriptional regulator [Paenibacillus sp. HB172176]|uniref:helix-turn-helix domain-containing protein n=1 Tax=Paenibacillus sp. HB172176 TaxID=2493690 RepID=UPI001438B9DA|nr:AraC family transcriptional regulator [Paenibacillus sp. HB172176]